MPPIVVGGAHSPRRRCRPDGRSGFRCARRKRSWSARSRRGHRLADQPDQRDTTARTSSTARTPRLRPPPRDLRSGDFPPLTHHKACPSAARCRYARTGEHGLADSTTMRSVRDDPELAVLVRTYVSPGRRYLTLGGNLIGMAEQQRVEFLASLADAAAQITPAELDLLLDGGWRGRKTAAWLIAVSRRTARTGTHVTVVRACHLPNWPSSVCTAVLTRFVGPAGRQHRGPAHALPMAHEGNARLSTPEVNGTADVPTGWDTGQAGPR